MYKLEQNFGYYINFEGGDGAGKTTQFDILKEVFNAEQLSSHINKEIKGIRSYIEELSKENPDLRLSYYLMASIHDSEKAKKVLEKGKNVITDRNIFSTLAYHRAMGSKFAKEINLSSLNILKPDITIYLDVEEKERFERMNLRGELSETDKHLESDRDFLKKVLEEYEKFGNYMVRIDTTNKSIQDVSLEVKRAILKHSNLTILKNSK